MPLDIGGGTSTTIVIEGYDRLKAEWGIPGETRVMNKPFRLAQLDEEVMLRLGSDTRPLTVKGPANWTPPPAPPGYFIDFWGVSWRQAFYGDGCYYWELCGHPLKDATIEDLETYPWPDVLDPGFTAGLEEEAKALYHGTDYAIMADGGFKSFWELAYTLRGLEQLLTDLVLNPEFVKALMEKLLELNLKGTGRFLDIAGPYIQVLRAADDLATQAGCMFSPKSYRTLLKPYYKRFFDFVKSKTDAKLFYHSCGNVAGFIDDLAEIGVRGAESGPGDGPGRHRGAQGPVRRQGLLLGRDRYAAGAAPGHPGRGRRGGPAAHPHPGTGRRVCGRLGAQRAARRAHRQHRGDGGRREEVGDLPAAGVVLGRRDRSTPCKMIFLPVFQTTYSPPSSVSPPWSHA